MQEEDLGSPSTKLGGGENEGRRGALAEFQILCNFYVSEIASVERNALKTANAFQDAKQMLNK